MMKRMMGALVIALLAIAMLATGCAEQQGDIVETAVSAGSFTTLVTALTEAGLVETLKGEGPFTVFAPTDDAFAKLPEGKVEELLMPENRELLKAILTYHVVPGNVMAADVVGLDSATTVNGQRLTITVDGGNVMVDKAAVTQTDIEATNGVIHVIDSVLMPATGTIVEVADKTGKFATLLTAVEAAGLTDVLMGEGPFTVFAPTDDAFAKLPGGTVESLLKPANLEKLQTILKYHVVSGRVYSDEVVAMDMVGTLADMEAPVSVMDGKVMVGDTGVVKTDIEATNGVIHVIDAVMMPPE
ncbi:MAG: fasciclin domain-containing protein [Candidatus Eisenbacteria bacterium]|nr:fasciclin domain-containing protein [Candidatus Eisenbacteria bacterium]